MMVGRMMVVCGGGGGHNRNHGVVNTSGIVLVVTTLEWLSLSLPSFVLGSGWRERVVLNMWCVWAVVAVNAKRWRGRGSG